MSFSTTEHWTRQDSSPWWQSSLALKHPLLYGLFDSKWDHHLHHAHSRHNVIFSKTSILSEFFLNWNQWSHPLLVMRRNAGLKALALASLFTLALSIHQRLSWLFFLNNLKHCSMSPQISRISQIVLWWSSRLWQRCWEHAREHWGFLYNSDLLAISRHWCP